jgi:hypothetical protein
VTGTGRGAAEGGAVAGAGGYGGGELPPHDNVDASAAERAIFEVFFVENMVFDFYTERPGMPIETAKTVFDRLAHGPGFG